MKRADPNHSMRVFIPKYLLRAALAGNEVAIDELDHIIRLGDCQMVWSDYCLDSRSERCRLALRK